MPLVHGDPENPNTSFSYYSDKYLWKDAFDVPFPKNLRSLKEGYINLSYYFYRIKIPDNEHESTTESQFIAPKDGYFNVTEKERAAAFVALRNFLIRFNRPFKKIFVSVPKHADVEYMERYNYASVVFRRPRHLVLKKDKTAFVVGLSKEQFYEFTKYSFNNEQVITQSKKEIPFIFNFKDFKGVVLKH